MPPKPRDRETEAVEAEEAKAAKRSRELFDAALDARLVSRVRPSSLTELKPSKVLKRSDCKDIHKRSSVKKSRYMTVFPGQLGNLKEGRLGSLAKLDTQNPVMYIEYPGFGRLKLCGTIVRSRATRYFTLNVKSKDRLNLEDWFDSMIVFSTCFWVGNAEENPGEEPRPFPEELKHVQAAAGAEAPNAEKETTTTPAKLADFAFSVAAEEGAAPKKSVVSDTRDVGNEGEQTRATAERAAISLDQSSDEDADEDDRAAAAAAAARPARPRRESAKAARYDFSEVDDFELEEEEEEEEKVFRGRVTATVAKEAAPLAAPKRRSVGAASGAAKKARSDSAAEPPPAAAAARSASPSEVVAISDDDDDDDDAPPEPSRGAGGKQTSLLGFLGGKKAEAEAPRRASAGAPRAAAAAPKPSKKFVLDSDSDSDSDSEPEDEDSDFEA